MKIKRNKKKMIKKGGNRWGSLTMTLPTSSEKFILQLRGRNENFIDFVKMNIHQLKEANSNSFLERVFDYIVSSPFYSNPLFKNTTWIRLLNLFTEKVIYMNDQNEIEPLPYSWMELEVFGYKDLYGEDEDPKIGEFMEFFFLQNYDLEQNPFFIGEEWIFEKLHKFIEYKEKKESENLVWRGESYKVMNQRGGKIEANRMGRIELETVREDLDSIHNFFKGRVPQISTSIKPTVEINLKKKVNLFKKSKNEMTRIRPQEKNTACKLKTPSFLVDFNFDKEKEKTKTNLQLGDKNNSLEYFENYQQARNKTKVDQNFESRYLEFIMKQGYIGSNVYYFSYDKNINIKTNKYIIFVKQLLYNALGRFNILINDASNFALIRNELLKELNQKTKDHLKLKLKIYLIYRSSVIQNKSVKINKQNESLNRREINHNIQKQKNETNAQMKKLKDEIEDYLKQLEEIKNRYLLQKEISILQELKKKIDQREVIEEKKRTELSLQQLKDLRDKLKFEWNSKEESGINYRSHTFASWGMISDPSKITGYHIKLFSNKVYERFLLEIFADLQLHNCTFEFTINEGNTYHQIGDSTELESFTKEKKMTKFNGFTLKIINNTINLNLMNRNIGNSKENYKLIHFLIDTKFSVKLINDIIRKLIDDHYKKSGKLQSTQLNLMNGIIPEWKQNASTGQMEKMKLPPFDFSTIPPKEKKIYESFDRLIKVLLNNQYNIQEITRFILRFKVMGDKLQGLEARYNCALINDYSDGTFKITEDDIYVKHRLLVTQDRPLSIFAQTENNINFLSKAKLNSDNFNVVYWNFGDAYHLKHIQLNQNMTQQVDYLPVISTFTMNRIFGLNETQIEREIKVFKDKIDKYVDFYDQEINPPKPKKKIPTPKKTQTQQKTSSTPTVWRGTLPEKPKKKIILKPAI